MNSLKGIPLEKSIRLHTGVYLAQKIPAHAPQRGPWNWERPTNASGSPRLPAASFRALRPASLLVSSLRPGGCPGSPKAVLQRACCHILDDSCPCPLPAQKGKGLGAGGVIWGPVRAGARAPLAVADAQGEPLPKFPSSPSLAASAPSPGTRPEQQMLSNLIFLRASEPPFMRPAADAARPGACFGA